MSTHTCTWIDSVHHRGMVWHGWGVPCSHGQRVASRDTWAAHSKWVDRCTNFPLFFRCVLLCVLWFFTGLFGPPQPIGGEVRRRRPYCTERTLHRFREHPLQCYNPLQNSFIRKLLGGAEEGREEWGKGCCGTRDVSINNDD